MPSKIKNKTPWILVIASMILLFMFVGYWNISSYAKEKTKLAEDVEIQLQLAFTETKDSELIYFIKTQLTSGDKDGKFLDSISIFFDSNPFLSNPNDSIDQMKNELKHSQTENDTSIIIDIVKNCHDTLRYFNNLSNKEIRVISTSAVNSIQVDSLEIKDSDSSKLEFRLKQINLNQLPKFNRNQNLLISDSSFVFNWDNDEDSFPSRFNSLLDFESDSFPSSFKINSRPLLAQTSVDKTYELFRKKLIANNLPSSFNIINDPRSKSEGLRVIYESNGFGFSDWTIDLQQYQIFIFKKMIPTLLFSLFLLGIIGLAFWTLLRNWIKQNRLVVVKNEFINNMTHELKTPIATVGVALEAISNFDLSTEQEKTKEYIDISRNEISRLSLLVDKVLNIATFDSKEITLKSEAIDLDQIIQNNLQSMKLQLDGKNTEINYQNNTANPIVLGDKLHLNNAVHNIIDNAFKYSGTNLKINIAINESQQNLKLTFADNGKGIPKEYHNKIFDRFFRVPSEDRHDVKGHGLGLNYVQNVIQNHGGKSH